MVLGKEKRWAHISLLQRVSIIVPVYLVSTLPDLFSVATYFRLRRHVALEAANEVVVVSPPYGGIYVGEEEEPPPSPQSLPQQQGESSCSKEVKCVLTALRTYSLTSMLDLVTLFYRIIAPELGMEDYINL